MHSYRRHFRCRAKGLVRVQSAFPGSLAVLPKLRRPCGSSHRHSGRIRLPINSSSNTSSVNSPEDAQPSIFIAEIESPKFWGSRWRFGSSFLYSLGSHTDLYAGTLKFGVFVKDYLCTVAWEIRSFKDTDRRNPIFKPSSALWIP